MELTEALSIIEKHLSEANAELGFKAVSKDDSSITFDGEKGSYRLNYDFDANVFAFDCAYEKGENGYEYSTISKSLFDLEEYNEKDAKSYANEVADELSRMFKVKKKVDLDKVKMPKAVSRT